LHCIYQDFVHSEGFDYFHFIAISLLAVLAEESGQGAYKFICLASGMGAGGCK
jgi:hypothetical protein